MKKIININLSGRVIPIEDAAYDSLQRYIESLRRYFAREEGRDEIINDIESRVAELMNDKVRKGAAAITEADMEEIIASMGRVEDFEQADAEQAAASASQAQTENTTYNFSQSRPRGRLYRNEADKLIGGVCSGIAHYLNMDPAIVRLLFAIITFGGFGTGILVYILLWIILPSSSMDSFLGKRLYRNPDDRVIGGVAGGLAAYFNKSATTIRLIFAAPLIINILISILRNVFDVHSFEPNLFIGSFTGTFILAYIILWIVLPEANSTFQKMEMRGETVDVNRIKENVQAGMTDFKNRMQAWGEEVKQTAQNMSSQAKTFTDQHAKPFASDFTNTVVKPAGSGIAHAIGVIFKAFFLFVAGCIALALFGVLMAFIFGGIAWWPINNFLWTSNYQKGLAWGTILFFIAVPVIGFITWLIRRLVKAKAGSRYLGWTFGGLWTIGWICAVLLVASIAKDLRRQERVETEVPVSISGDRILVRVSEPRIQYSGGMWGVHDNDGGWDITDDSMRYDNVKVRVDKSEDNNYHVSVYKYSQGSSASDARNRAAQTRFTAFTADSVLNIGSGLSFGKESKFRGQSVMVEIRVPVGKQIRFDETVADAFHPWVIRTAERSGDRRSRGRYRIEWDWDESFEWQPNVNYVMTSEGSLAEPGKVNITNDGIYKKDNEVEIQQEIENLERQMKEREDRLRELKKERDQKLDEDIKRLEELRRKRGDSLRGSTTG